jgi:hypothetical protein
MLEHYFVFVGSLITYFIPGLGVGGNRSPLTTVLSIGLGFPVGDTNPACADFGTICPGLNVFFDIKSFFLSLCVPSNHFNYTGKRLAFEDALTF